VRAAVARELGRLPLLGNVLIRLLGDDNWHVRGCALLGLPTAVPPRARSALTSDPSRRRPPPQVAWTLVRIGLCSGDAALVSQADGAVEPAVLGMLRESRTGWTPLPARVLDAAIARGLAGPGWVVQREAAAVRDGLSPTTGTEAFRRLRGRRSVQVALDLQDLDQAVDMARQVSAAGVTLIEVGDPLIKRVGLRAVTEIKKAVPDTAVVAEMMSADWGRDQVELAAEAGADVVLLIGLASITSVAAAVGAGRRLGVPIMLDTPPGPLDQRWVRDMERTGSTRSSSPATSTSGRRQESTHCIGPVGYGRGPNSRLPSPEDSGPPMHTQFAARSGTS